MTFVDDDDFGRGKKEGRMEAKMMKKEVSNRQTDERTKAEKKLYMGNSRPFEASARRTNERTSLSTWRPIAIYESKKPDRVRKRDRERSQSVSAKPNITKRFPSFIRRHEEERKKKEKNDVSF